MVTLGHIRTFCSDWIDIHGQYDNQQILDPENHIRITDSFHSEALAPELEKLSSCYDEYKAAQKEYEDLLKAEANAAQLLFGILFSNLNRSVVEIPKESPLLT